jgi:hypothetical protein
MPTFTTNCRYLVSTVLKRPMLGCEVMLNMGVPTIARAAEAAGVSRADLGDISQAQQATLAGNAMHVPSVGAVILLALVFVKAKA